MPHILWSEWQVLDSMADAGSFSLSWLSVVIKTQSGFSHMALWHFTLMYIIRLIRLNMFTLTVSLTGGQNGDLNFVKGLT